MKVISEGATMFYEIFDGVQESPVFGDEYILTHADSGRQFMVLGSVEGAMSICSEYIRMNPVST